MKLIHITYISDILSVKEVYIMKSTTKNRILKLSILSILLACIFMGIWYLTKKKEPDVLNSDYIYTLKDGGTNNFVFEKNSEVDYVMIADNYKVIHDNVEIDVAYNPIPQFDFKEDPEATYLILRINPIETRKPTHHLSSQLSEEFSVLKENPYSWVLKKDKQTPLTGKIDVIIVSKNSEKKVAEATFNYFIIEWVE